MQHQIFENHTSPEDLSDWGFQNSQISKKK